MENLSIVIDTLGEKIKSLKSDIRFIEWKNKELTEKLEATSNENIELLKKLAESKKEIEELKTGNFEKRCAE